MNCLVDDVITYTSVMEKEIMIHGDKVKKQYVFLSSAIGRRGIITKLRERERKDQ